MSPVEEKLIFVFFHESINFWKDLPLLKMSTHNPLIGNCEEELPKKPVGRLSVNCRPTGYRQSTDRLGKKKNCVKTEQLT